MQTRPTGEPHVRVRPYDIADEVAAAKAWYADSEWQPIEYPDPPPRYATILADLIASLAPRSVLEFGCNAGRNLAVLKQRFDGPVKGVDLNGRAIRFGRERFGLDLEIADESYLERQPDRSSDLIFTISVLDHVPDIGPVADQLVRVADRFLVLLEIVHRDQGRITEMQSADGSVVAGYPFSYFHDYRRLFETERGLFCLLDASVPVGTGDLLEFYRLYLFTKDPVHWGRNVLQLFRAGPS